MAQGTHDRGGIPRYAVLPLLRAGRIGGRTVWRQFELARPRLVSGELSDRGIFAKVSSLLWRRFQNRVSNGLGKIHHAVGGGQRIDAPADVDLPARSGRLPPGI